MADLLTGPGIASDLSQESLEVRAVLVKVLLCLVGPAQEIVAREKIGIGGEGLLERRDGGVEVFRLDGFLARQKILDAGLLLLSQGNPTPDRESHGPKQPLVHETVSFGLDFGSCRAIKCPSWKSYHKLDPRGNQERDGRRRFILAQKECRFGGADEPNKRCVASPEGKTRGDRRRMPHSVRPGRRVSRLREFS